jgi:hypothetical protein
MARFLGYANMGRAFFKPFQVISALPGVVTRQGGNVEFCTNVSTERVSPHNAKPLLGAGVFVKSKLPYFIT